MATTNNPYLSLEDADLVDDFGFSFSNEDDIVAEATAPTVDEIADLKKRLEAVRKIIYHCYRTYQRIPISLSSSGLIVVLCLKSRLIN